MNSSKFIQKMLVIAIFLVISLPVFASEKTMDIRISPFISFLGAIDGEFNFKMSENVTVAPMLTYWNYKDDLANEEFNITTVGARAYWHPGGVFKDGFYVSPFYRLWNLTVDVTNDFGNSATGSAGIHQFGATAGYLWQWNNFNTNIGLGYTVLNFGKITAKDDLGNESESSFDGASTGGTAIDLSVGYAF